MKKEGSELKSINWHSLPLGEVFALLRSKREGLSSIEAKIRLSAYGPNIITTKPPDGFVKVFARQFKSPLVFLLVIAGVTTLLLNFYLDAIVIFSAVIVNTIVGFLQEKRALKTFRYLKKKERFFAWVRRDGLWKEIEVNDLVPGDVVMLRPGDRVPADLRLVLAQGLFVNEAILTGESMPSPKKIEAIKPDKALADRGSMVWMGTTVEDGRGMGIVITTGDKTEFGKVFGLLESTQNQKTPFEKKIVKLGRFLTMVILVISALLFGGGVIAGNSVEEMFLVAVAIAVSAIPESLPVAVTVILAIGMMRILKEHGLVKRLSAAEALGSTSVILTDKTGTLTMGKMNVSSVFVPVKERGELVLNEADERKKNYLLAMEIGLLVSEVIVENPHENLSEWIVKGRPTDKALFIAASKMGLEREGLNKHYPIIEEIPFTSLRKFSASLRKDPQGNKVSFFAGAPEVVLKHLNKVEVSGQSLFLNSDDRAEIRDSINKFASRGLRIILVGYKQFGQYEEIKSSSKSFYKQILEGGTFVAIIGISDPVRPDAAQMVEFAGSAGIRMVMVTGDHALSAQAVAKEIGILGQKQTMAHIMEGPELELIDAGELARRVSTIEIYARVSPEQKVKIVEAWQKQGEVVAIAGDGVNDAPALKHADVGVALGTGTDITKEAADIVLLNNSFATIVTAIKEGRVVFDNLKKVVLYLLTDSFSEIILVSLALLLGLQLPILPAQILWVNLVEGSLPSIALAFDPPEKDVMEVPPAPPKSPLIDSNMKKLLLLIATVTNIVLFGLFILFASQRNDIEYVRTVIFAALSINSLFYAFSIRSLRKPIWEISLFANKYLLGAVAVGLVLIGAALYLPILNTLLRTVPLGVLEWIILIGFGILNIVAIEIGKWMFLRKKPELRIKN